MSDVFIQSFLPVATTAPAASSPLPTATAGTTPTTTTTSLPPQHPPLPSGQRFTKGLHDKLASIINNQAGKPFQGDDQATSSASSVSSQGEGELIIKM